MKLNFNLHKISYGNYHSDVKHTIERLNSIQESATGIRRINSMIRFFFHENPDLLTDEQWAMRDGELNYMLRMTGRLKTGKDGKKTFINTGQ